MMIASRSIALSCRLLSFNRTRELDQLLETCRLAVKERQDAAATAERRRFLIRKLAASVVGIVVLGLLISVGFQIRSAFRASVINEGIPSDVQADFSAANQPVDLPLALPTFQNSIEMQFKLLPSGTFTLGSKSGRPDEQPLSPVTLTQPFNMSVFEVTQEQYQRVMRNNPTRSKGAQKPVANVTWKDAVEFCQNLSALPEEKAAGRTYRLPTEAEWEYACRAGTTTEYSFGNDEDRLDEYGWYRNNSNTMTQRVGQKQPNPWGLYDMHGNVWEWCLDWYGPPPRVAVTDPMGPSFGSHRVRRGGGSEVPAWFCCSPNRDLFDPAGRSEFLGFRVVLSPSGRPE